MKYFVYMYVCIYEILTYEILSLSLYIYKDVKQKILILYSYISILFSTVIAPTIARGSPYIALSTSFVNSFLTSNEHFLRVTLSTYLFSIT